MDIYKARKLQNICFNASNASFKRMKTAYLDGKLYYLIYHCISNDNIINIGKNELGRIKDDVEKGMFIHILYFDEIAAKSYGISSGMYVRELIEID